MSDVWTVDELHEALGDAVETVESMSDSDEFVGEYVGTEIAVDVLELDESDDEWDEL